MDSAMQTDALYIPPFAKPLSGKEGTLRALYVFMRNPIEGFGPLSYS